MRVLLIGALGLILLGCSHSSAPQAAMTSCADDGAGCNDGTVAPPAEPTSFTPHLETTSLAPRPATTAKPSSADADAVSAAPAIASRLARAAADFGDAQASVTEQRAAKAQSAPSSSGSGESRALARAALDNDALVAVVMARPNVKALSELAGKTIAIDDRYSAANGSVRTAIVAAGAPAVQLSEGQTTAMSRVTNGEVPAAVVALVAPDAAEEFPAISGYKMFHVPLSPRAMKGAH